MTVHWESPPSAGWAAGRRINACMRRRDGTAKRRPPLAPRLTLIKLLMIYIII